MSYLESNFKRTDSALSAEMDIMEGAGQKGRASALFIQIILVNLWELEKKILLVMGSWPVSSC